MTRLLLIVALLFSPLIEADEASDLAAREARLERLRDNMATVSERLSEQRERAGGVEADLARLEQRLNEAQVAERQRALSQRRAEAKEHQAFLAATVRAAYRRGDASTLRLLLGDFNPAELQRLLVYRQRLGAARAERITRAQTAVAALAAERQALEQALAEQRRVRTAREDALAQVQSSLNQRQALLAELEARIDDDQAVLASQREQAQSLTELIASLREQLAQSGAPTRQLDDLGRARGALSWPHEGPLLARYGGERAAGLDWTGLLIGGQAGAPDYVAPDDVIATVGRSGGRPETALYFELRAEGEPVDPLAWLSPANQSG
jgi:septal ring factor EnvC (AmiA/AmiB activator)